MAHSRLVCAVTYTAPVQRFDQFGASFAVFGNPILDWALHPTNDAKSGRVCGVRRPPSTFPRTIVVSAATLSSSESSDFSARHEEGIVFSKNHVENLAIGTAEGNADHARQPGYRRRRVPPTERTGVRHDGRRIRGYGWGHRSCIASAACG